MSRQHVVTVIAGILFATGLLHAAPVFASDGSNGNPFTKLPATSAASLQKVRAKGVNLQAELDGNTITNNGTINGTNLIDGGSFAGASGAFTVLQNTGNAAILQNSTTVEVNFPSQ